MTDEIAQTASHIDSRRRLATLALHALFIGIIFILPEALLRVAIPGRTLDITWPMYAKSCITIAVFYLNYFLLIPHTLSRDSSSRWQFVGWNVLAVVGGAVAIWLIYRFAHAPNRYQVSPLAGFSFVFRDAIMLVLAASLAVAIRISAKWINLERRHQNLEAFRRKSELDSLRSQLNPHFLFNTLNSIYALIAIQPEQAQKAVHDLSALLRYVVYDNPMVVPLDRELEFVQNYVELMRLRMGQRPVQLSIERHDDEEMQIAPLIFVTLVENAFKHGNTADTSNPISISIKSDGSKITCSTVNHFDNVPRRPAHNGVGLANLKRRIELVYGSNGSFDSCVTDDGRYCSTLSVGRYKKPIAISSI